MGAAIASYYRQKDALMRKPGEFANVPVSPQQKLQPPPNQHVYHQSPVRALWQDRFGYDQQYDNATTPLVPSPSAPLGVEGMRIGRPLNLQERYNTVMNRADAVENDTPQPYDLDPRVWRR